MAGQLILPKNELLNANLYIDYENIFELLMRYGSHPMELNFFPIILDRYKNRYHLNIVDCIVYCDFEKESFPRKHQTALQNFGIQFRHAASAGENCNGMMMMMTTDAITTLYKNPNINKFVIISSGWDMTPLLKLIRFENKSADVNFSRHDFDPDVASYVEHYDYIEDMFNLAPETIGPDEAQEANLLAKQVDFYHGDQPQTVESEKLRYSSDANAWRGVAKRQAVRLH